jgi:choline monooxygenase
LEPLKKRLEELSVDLFSNGNLKFVLHREYYMECNWKVFIDNYLDGGYHVPFIHPDLTSELDLSTYQSELLGKFSIQSVMMKSSNTNETGKPVTQDILKV